jgi:hypothetical protein
MGNSVVSYRQSAAQCLTLSRKTGDPADRESLVTMAQRWLELAERTHEFHCPEKTKATSTRSATRMSRLGRAP